jgi:hypothetical protein
MSNEAGPFTVRPGCSENPNGPALVADTDTSSADSAGTQRRDALLMLCE